MFPNTHVSSLVLLDWITENPQEHCHKTRRTLMSPQEWKIARCTPNQIEVKPIYPALAPQPFPRSTSYRISGLTCFRNIQRFPEIPASRLEEYQFRVQQLEESSVRPLSSQDENWFPVFDGRGKPTFHKHLKRSFTSEIGLWEGPCVFCLKWNGPREALTWKKAGFPCSGLNAGSSFISQDEGMSESPVDTIGNALGLRLIWTGDLTSLWHLERHAEFSASKGDYAWLFWKIDRNPNISVEIRKGSLVSHLTSRSVCIILPSLV